MFASHELLLGISFDAARARLVNLTHGGWLAASGGAYADGLAGLTGAGTFGDMPGTPELVSVRLLEPVTAGDGVRLPLRWEAIGAAGRLFTVLDADLTLIPADGQALMRLHGAYRRPLAGIGTSADQIVLRRAASATLRSLLTRVAAAVTGPAPAAVNAPRPRRQLVTDPPASA